MLSLSRKKNESIVLLTSHDEIIEIKTGHNLCGSVKLLFDAPKTVKIVRKELIDRNRNGWYFK